MIEDDFVETSDVEELADNLKSMHSSSSPLRRGGPVRDELLEDPPRKRIKVCRSPAMLFSMDAALHLSYSSFMADRSFRVPLVRSLVVPFGVDVTELG